MPTNTDAGPLGNTPAGTLKGCLTFVTALIVSGAVAEMLYNINPGVAYTFVAIVIIGYASTNNGANLEKISGFVKSAKGA